MAVNILILIGSKIALLLWALLHKSDINKLLKTDKNIHEIILKLILEPVILVAALDVILHLAGKAKASAIPTTSRHLLFRNQCKSLVDQRGWRRETNRGLNNGDYLRNIGLGNVFNKDK